MPVALNASCNNLPWGVKCRGVCLPRKVKVRQFKAQWAELCYITENKLEALVFC